MMCTSRRSPLWCLPACAVLAAMVFTGVAQAQATWTLTETLRIGGADAGPTSFNYVKSIAVDSRGRIFVYDRQSQDIRMFAADGRVVKVFGRKGSGPGELRDAEGIAFARDGVLWVRDAANARLSLFSADGVFQKGWTMTFCSSQGPWNPQMDRQGRILAEDCMVREGRAYKNAVLAYHTDRSRVDTLPDMPACGSAALSEAGTWITRRTGGATYRSIPYAVGVLTALGPEGEVWCVANSANYEVLRIASGARDTTRVSRRVIRAPVTTAERDANIAELELKGPTGLDFSRIPTLKPAIDRLTVDDQGRLWIRRTNAKGLIELDIVNASGRVIATAELGVVKTSIWSPFVVRGESVYAVVLDTDDVPFVARYRITR